MSVSSKNIISSSEFELNKLYWICIENVSLFYFINLSKPFAISCKAASLEGALGFK